MPVKALHQVNLFCNTVKALISSKGTLSNDNIIESPIGAILTVKGGNLVSIKAKDEIRDEKILVEMFNNHYTNTVEKSSGSPPKSIGSPSNPDNDKCTVQN